MTTTIKIEITEQPKRNYRAPDQWAYTVKVRDLYAIPPNYNQVAEGCTEKPQTSLSEAQQATSQWLKDNFDAKTK